MSDSAADGTGRSGMEALSNLRLRRYRCRPLANRGEDIGEAVERMEGDTFLLAVGREHALREDDVDPRGEAVVRFAIAHQHHRPSAPPRELRAHGTLANAAAGGAVGVLMGKRQVEAARHEIQAAGA